MMEGMKRLSHFKLTKGLKLLFTVGVTSLLYSSLLDYYGLLHLQAQPQIQQQPQPIMGIKITSPVSNQVPVGELTISGTSTDNATTDCTVYTDWNNTKPFQKAVATGPGGANDYSTWNFTYTDKYHLIINGTNNLTSKLSCFNNNNGGTANLTKYYSLDVIGVSFGDNRIKINANYTIPLIVKVPPQPIIVEATNQSGSLVNYNVSATDNTDMFVAPICDPPSGSIFSLGNTTVKCTAIDNNGNSAAASFNVIVHNPAATTTTFTITETGTYNEANDVQ
jgi:HYR domain-containing protein